MSETKTTMVGIPKGFPAGRIVTFSEWGDDDDDWIVGIGHRENYVLICTCPTKELANDIAKLIRRVKRT